MAHTAETKTAGEKFEKKDSNYVPMRGLNKKDCVRFPSVQSSVFTTRIPNLQAPTEHNYNQFSRAEHHQRIKLSDFLDFLL